MEKLEKRVLEISYKNKLSHIGSCLSALPIIKAIYDIKKPNEKFVLSAGHSALALYVVLESKGGRNAEQIFKHHGVHPDRCSVCGIDCSSGSLGQGLPIALGMALADRKRAVYCLISDGECAEGSIWESLRIKEDNKIDNLRILVNMNGWGAYQQIDLEILSSRIRAFDFFGEIEFWGTNFNTLMPVLSEPQEAHYKVLSEKEYEKLVH